MHDKKTLILYFMVGTISLVIIALGVLSYLNFNTEIEVVDFSNYTVTEIEKWSKDNDVKYELEYQFDDVIEKGKVVSQSVKANQMIKSKD
ncbi:MAG: PASTA domain-containing protein, partial [Erysipelotrichaceae bacterium]|nr:PASTA domain-containing protein [Erysipelotrichaceae bacterium]